MRAAWVRRRGARLPQVRAVRAGGVLHARMQLCRLGAPPAAVRRLTVGGLVECVHARLRCERLPMCHTSRHRCKVVVDSAGRGSLTATWQQARGLGGGGDCTAGAATLPLAQTSRAPAARGGGARSPSVLLGVALKVGHEGGKHRGGKSHEIVIHHLGGRGERKTLKQWGVSGCTLRVQAPRAVTSAPHPLLLQRTPS